MNKWRLHNLTTFCFSEWSFYTEYFYFNDLSEIYIHEIIGNNEEF